MDGEKTPIGKQPRQVALCTNVSSQMSTAKCQQPNVNSQKINIIINVINQQPYVFLPMSSRLFKNIPLNGSFLKWEIPSRHHGFQY